jgi:beta-fructofuranosidase
MEPSTLYRPRSAWVGDVIPFFHDGAFWLFYLHDRRPGPDEPVGTDWYLLRTTDFVDFEEFGCVLPHGDATDPDLHCYTGCVVEAEDGFHLFYTGFNPAIIDEEDGQPLQAVMHAVGSDLRTWTKLPEDTFYAPRGQYDRHDWRDPYVFRQEDGRWGMLLATRLPGLPSRRGGCVGLMVSDDLRTWRPADPFWAPGLWMTHECPDLFRIGDWWYLVTSEFTDRYSTHYRISRSPLGPWVAPPEDSLDGRANYALKTASDGEHTYAFGWLATREDETDEGPWQWGGSLVTHELRQRQDGTLAVSLPPSVCEQFARVESAALRPVRGRWTQDGTSASVDATGTYAAAVGPEITGPSLVQVDFAFTPGTRAIGLLITNGDDPEHAYSLRVEPAARRLVFDRWPRRTSGPLQWQIGGEAAHVLELERHIDLDPDRQHRLEVIVDGSACIAYLDAQVALSTRIYGAGTRRVGWFVTEGAGTLSAMVVRSLPEQLPPVARSGGSQ